MERKWNSPAEQRAHHAGQDPLTGVSGRKKFEQETAQLLMCKSERYVLIYLNVGRFKIINDLFGSAVGDALLQKMAVTLTAAAAEGTCGRVEADRFVLCRPKAGFLPAALLESIRADIRSAAPRCGLQVQLGIYEIEDITLPVDQICDRALLALRRLEEHPTAPYLYYDEEMRRRFLEEQELTGEMENALETGQFHIYLQPIFSLTTGVPIGAEAVVRWQHPTRGTVSPEEFVPLFEQNGFITKLDAYVWEKVFAHLSFLQKKGFGEFPISANMSRLDIYNPNLCDEVLALSRKYGVNPALFRIEITESAYMENPHQLLAVVEQFNARGFRMVMDDFGSGYSSLNMLADIPVSILKVDMRFVRDVAVSERSNSVMNSVIRMAKWLEMTVVAEGVETQEQLDYLKSIGCDLVQGYYYAKPLPLEKFDGYLSAFQREVVAAVPAVFDAIDIGAIWATLTQHDALLGGVLGALGLYELAGDTLEIICVNDAYYALMNSTADSIFKDTKNALAWVCEGDRARMEEAFRLAREKNERRQLFVRRYIGMGKIKKLFTAICYLGRKDDRYLYSISAYDVTEAEDAAAVPALHLRAQESGRPRILLVEDNRVSRATLRSMLACAYEVLEAENGRQGLEILLCDPQVTAVLLDTVMPVMDGYEFLRRKQCNATLRDIPTLVLSQSENAYDEKEALLLGAWDFLCKPYDAEDLLRRLAQLIPPAGASAP